MIWRIPDGVIRLVPEASVLNTTLDLHNSSDDTKAEFNNWQLSLLTRVRYI